MPESEGDNEASGGRQQETRTSESISVLLGVSFMLTGNYFERKKSIFMIEVQTAEAEMAEFY